MKKYNEIMASLVLTALIMVSPVLVFAEKDNVQKNGGNNNKERTEQNDRKEDKEKIKNKSWFSSNWFNSKNATTLNLPVISDVNVSVKKLNKATITWKTDSRSNSYIWYSTVSPVNVSINPTLMKNNRNINHKILIKKLIPNTTYYVVVGSANKNGEVKSNEIVFTTSDNYLANNKPIITSVTGQNTLILGETESIVLNGNDPQNKALNYSVNWGDGIKILSTPFINNSVSLTHLYSNVGIYEAKFTLKNIDGKETTYKKIIKVEPSVVIDTVAPVISNVSITINSNNATLSWTTNEPATSRIYYSKSLVFDINAVDTQTINNETLTTNHSINIPTLTSNSLYHFKLKSVDASNNVVLSSESAFMSN